jgi:CelD/BcsL family acetyltransferase involved in cellulose biosynthesis
MSLSIVSRPDPVEWEAFVRDHPGGNVFHTPQMHEIFARAGKFEPSAAAAVDERGKIHALLPLVRTAAVNGPLGRLTSHAVAYGGVLCSPGEQGREGLDLLMREATARLRRSTLFTELRHHGNTEEIRPILERNGYRFRDHLNYIIDLEGGPDRVFERIGRRTRKHIRRGIRKGSVEIEEVREAGNLAPGYALLKDTYRRARLPLASADLFESAFRILFPLNMIRVTLARVAGRPASVSIELIYKQTLHGWYGGTDRRFAAETPTELVMWDILRWGSENSFRRYDFGGAGKPEESYGVRDFKAKFGGTLVRPGRSIRVHHRFLHALLNRGYKLIRGIV